MGSRPVAPSGAFRVHAMDYWGYATQCLIVAQRQDNAADKLTMINMAKAWVTLALQAQRRIAQVEAQRAVLPIGWQKLRGAPTRPVLPRR
jgi:hypothetical protein